MINPADLLQWKSLIKNALAKYFAPMPPSDGEIYAFQDGVPVQVGGSGGAWLTETFLQWGDSNSYAIDIAPGATEIEISFDRIYGASGSQKFVLALGDGSTFYDSHTTFTETLFGTANVTGTIGTTTAPFQFPKLGSIYLPTTGINFAGLIKFSGHKDSGGTNFRYAITGIYGDVGTGANFATAHISGQTGLPSGVTPTKLRISKTGTNDLYGNIVVRSR